MKWFFEAALVLSSTILVALNQAELRSSTESRHLSASGQRRRNCKINFMSSGKSMPEGIIYSLMFKYRYCIPMDDDRPVTTAEERFFNTCGTGKGEQLWVRTLLSTDLHSLRSPSYSYIHQ